MFTLIPHKAAFTLIVAPTLHAGVSTIMAYRFINRFLYDHSKYTFIHTGMTLVAPNRTTVGQIEIEFGSPHFICLCL